MALENLHPKDLEDPTLAAGGAAVVADRMVRAGSGSGGV